MNLFIRMVLVQIYRLVYIYRHRRVRVHVWTHAYTRVRVYIYPWTAGGLIFREYIAESFKYNYGK